MAQITSGIRTVLENPIVYSTFQFALGSKRVQRLILSDYLKLKDGMSILDVGCGPADILGSIQENVFYYGFDFEPSYIEKARKKYGDRGTFICEDVTNFEFEGSRKFDRILISAVLHHLDDPQVNRILAVLAKLLSPDGYLLSLENTFVEDQSFLARAIIKMDRGQNVRTPEGYLNLCRNHFKNCKYEVRHDLLRIPYTHILITCSN